MTLMPKNITEMYLFKKYLYNKAKNVLIYYLPISNVSVCECFILLAVMCKIAGTIFSLFLAGKFRIKSFHNQKELSVSKKFGVHFMPTEVKIDTFLKKWPVGYS